MRLGEQEANKQELLRAKLKEKGLTNYSFESWVVYLDTTEKAKVRKQEPAEHVRDAAAKREAREAANGQ